MGLELRRMAAIGAVLALGPETANGEFPVPRVALRSRESWPWVMVLAAAAEGGDHACAPDCPCWKVDGPGVDPGPEVIVNTGCREHSTDQPGPCGGKTP